jgi:hypothetical protein
MVDVINQIANTCIESKMAQSRKNHPQRENLFAMSNQEMLENILDLENPLDLEKAKRRTLAPKRTATLATNASGRTVRTNTVHDMQAEEVLQIKVLQRTFLLLRQMCSILITLITILSYN